MTVHPTRGVLFVHSAAAALLPHIESALSNILGMSVSLQWTAQPAQPGTWRAENSWSGDAGTAASIASAMRGWERLRFEVTEDMTANTEGERFSYTPTLGIFRIPEDKLKSSVVRAALGETTLMNEIDKLLGKPWDDELESFRYAGEGAPVKWLHQVV